MSALSAQQLRLAKRMATDAATAELARTFRERGIRWLLLKGPVTAARLYKDGTFRDYLDIDVLVGPSDQEAAARALIDLGYELGPQLPRGELEHASTWRRERDRSTVDLHRYLPYAGSRREEAWTSLLRDSEVMTVGGETVEITGYPAFALLMVFHALHNAPEPGKHLSDLERAVTEIPLAEWNRARALAIELGVERDLAAGLELTPSSSALRATLGLPRIRSWEKALRSGPVSRLALPMSHVSEAKGVGKKLRALRSEAVPSRQTQPFFEKAYSSSSMPALVLQRLGRVIRKTPLAIAVWFLRRRDQRAR